MLVYLLRHGIAQDREDPASPPDEKRSLTAKGVIRTRRACRGLRVIGVAPELILTSPLLRAAQTAEIAADELALKRKQVEETDALRPAAPPAELLAEVRRRKVPSVLLVGHAPDMDETIAHALGVDRPVTSLKKSGAAGIELPDDGETPGTLLFVIEPKALRRLRRAANADT
jgi:phosphohistidine phosphatase